MPNFTLDSDNIVILFDGHEDCNVTEVIIQTSSGEVVSKLISTDRLCKISFSEMNIYEDKISTISKEGCVDIGHGLSRFLLDVNLLEDEYYMTKNIANAATRPYDQNEIFFVCYQALNIIPVYNHFYASCITLCSYKLLELGLNKYEILEKLYCKWKLLNTKGLLNTANNIRWYVSCSMSLSLLMLVNDRVDYAEDILTKSTKNSAYSHRYNHLTYWNYCQLTFLYGMILVNKNNFRDASLWFLEAFNVSRNGILDIYNPRNDWLLGQLSDCEALLQLGSQSIICSIKSSGGEIPKETRTTQKCNMNKKVDLSVVFSRVTSLKQKKIKFFESVANKLEA